MPSINGDKMDGALPGSLQGLSQSLEARSHLLAGPGDENVAALALQATKSIFDLGLALESQSHPHLHPFLLSVLQPPTIALRSSTLAKSKAPPPPPQPKPEEVLPYTPLSELTVAGLESEQIWAQLELRADGICKAVGEVAAPEEEDEEGGDDESTDDEEDGSDEDISIEEFKKMMMEQGEEYDSDEIEAMFGDRGSTDSEDEEGDSDEEEDDDEDDEEDSEDDEEDEDSGDEEDSDIAEEVDWEDDEDAARFAELEGEVPGSEEEDEEDEEEDSDDGEEEDEEEDSDDGEEEDDEEDDDDAALSEDDDDLLAGDEEGNAESENDEEDAFFGQAGPSRPRPRHPTLDDDFFSIDDFNRLTEQQEANRVSGGRLGGDEDEDDEELGDVSELMLRGGDEDVDVMYGDFFAPPRSAPAAGKKGKGKAGPAAKGKGKDAAKGKGKGVQFADDDDEDMDQDDPADDDEEGGEASGVMGRVKGDLFDSDDEDGAEAQNLSTHEKQQVALAKQIAELEQQAVGPKDWTLLGEASARARPENSLLEEDLDFEQVGKVVPVITEDAVKSLEDLIKQRIIDNNFDSVVRVRAYEPTAFLPSRYFELQDTRSTQSLAQIYEDEYQAAASGSARVDARDAKLSAEHEEIDRVWGEICYKLDALSSLHFVPKAPKAQITTVANLPTASLESALPPTATSATLMAPEEVAAPAGAKELVARSELTPEEKQRARQKKRKHRQAEGKRLEELAELYGKKRKSAKEEKEDALKSLVKGGKGVTVVGKGAKESGKAQKRASGSGDREDGKRLKL